MLKSKKKKKKNLPAKLNSPFIILCEINEVENWRNFRQNNLRQAKNWHSSRGRPGTRMTVVEDRELSKGKKGNYLCN
jgi:hypothetical protein